MTMASVERSKDRTVRSNVDEIDHLIIDGTEGDSFTNDVIGKMTTIKERR